MRNLPLLSLLNDFNAAAAALLFYLGPLFLGRAVYIGYTAAIARTKRIPVIRHHLASVPFLPFTWFVFGSLVLFISALVSRYLLLPFAGNAGFIDVWQVMLGLLFAGAAAVNCIVYPILPVSRLFRFSGVLAGVSVLSFLGYSVWQHFSPYPFNWDLYHHQTLVQTILSGRYSFVTSQVTDTFIFNGYSSLFHTLLACAQLPFRPEVFPFWHWVSFLHLITTVLASYYIAREITGNRLIGVISALTGAFIFESIVVFTSFFLIPQTFTSVLFAFAVTQLLAFRNRTQTPALRILIPTAMFLLISHYVMGTVAIAILAGIYLYYRYHNRVLPYLKQLWVWEAALLCIIAALLVSALLPLGFINEGEGAAYTFTLVDKFGYMVRVYGYLLLLFVPIGIVRIVHQRKEPALVVLLSGLAIFSLVLTQLPYIIKYYVLARYLIHTILAIGVYALLSYIPYTKARIGAVGVYGIGLIMILANNTLVWQNFMWYRGYTAQVSEYEIEAAAFLKKVYSGTNTLIISDPGTQHILEPLSGLNSQGGAYMNIDSRRALHQFHTATGEAELREALVQVKDTVEPEPDTRLIIVSGRYMVWQNSSLVNKENISYNVWFPHDLTYTDRLKLSTFYARPDLFQQVYANPALVIFKLKQ